MAEREKILRQRANENKKKIDIVIAALEKHKSVNEKLLKLEAGIKDALKDNIFTKTTQRELLRGNLEGLKSQIRREELTEIHRKINIADKSIDAINKEVKGRENEVKKSDY